MSNSPLAPMELGNKTAEVCSRILALSLAAGKGGAYESVSAAKLEKAAADGCDIYDAIVDEIKGDRAETEEITISDIRVILKRTAEKILELLPQEEGK